MIIQNSSTPSAPVASSAPAARPAAPTTAPTQSPVTSQTSSANASLQQPVPAESLSVAVDTVNNALRSSGSSLQFSVDRDTDIGVVTVVDSGTGEVIRQIPSEEALAIARSIDAFLAQSSSSPSPGLLFQHVA